MTIQNTLSSDVMLQLGSFRFGVSTAAYQDLARVTEHRWGQQDRFGKLPALQYVGPGAETITLQGLIYTEWRGGIGQPDALRALAALGQPQTLVDGMGVVHGRWVVERVDERQTAFAGAGLPRKQEFTVAIRRYDDGEAASGLRSDGLPSALTPSTLTAPQPFASQVAAAAEINGLANSGRASAATLSSALSASMARVSSLAAVLGATKAASAAGALARTLDVTASLSASFDAAQALTASPSSARNLAAAGGLLTAGSDATITSTSSAAVLARTLSGLTSTVDQGTTAAVRTALINANALTRLCRDTAAAASGISDRITTP